MHKPAAENSLGQVRMMLILGANGRDEGRLDQFNCSCWRSLRCLFWNFLFVTTLFARNYTFRFWLGNRADVSKDRCPDKM